MSKIGQLAHRVAFLVDRQQLSVNVSVNFQTLFHPKYVLGATIHPLQPMWLPSNAMIRSYKSNEVKKGNFGAKPIKRRYTPEEDQKLLEYVSVHGRTYKSFKDIAEALDRPIKSVSNRCYSLMSKTQNEIKTNPKAWDYDEDKKLVDHIFQSRQITSNNIAALMIIKPNEFKDIGEYMKRSTNSLYQRWRRVVDFYLIPQMQDLATSKTLRIDVLTIVARSHQKTAKHKGYSDDDKKLIIKRVEWKGDIPETWEFLAKKLGKTPTSVKSFYFSSILHTPKVNGPFSAEEDEIILRHVEANGKNSMSFIDLAKELGRCSPASIKIRHKKLISTNHFEITAKQKEWKLDDDKTLLKHVLNIRKIKANDVSSLETMKLSELTAVAKELKRSSSSCYNRWIRVIVPTLKSHIKTLPLTDCWKKDVLSYIVKNKIQHMKELDYTKILEELAPGQTSLSLIAFVKSMKKKNLPLCDVASKRLDKQGPDNRFGPFNENHKGEQKRLEWLQNITSYYKTLI